VGLFRTKSIDALIAASEDPEKKLRRTLGPWSLTAFGIGAVIGSGIFILNRHGGRWRNPQLQIHPARARDGSPHARLPRAFHHR